MYDTYLLTLCLGLVVNKSCTVFLEQCRSTSAQLWVYNFIGVLIMIVCINQFRNKYFFTADTMFSFLPLTQLHRSVCVLPKIAVEYDNSFQKSINAVYKVRVANGITNGSRSS